MLEFIEKPTTIGMLDDGLAAIWHEVQRNTEMGKRTDVPGLLEKLRQSIYKQTGHAYQSYAMLDLYELWIVCQEKEPAHI